MKRASLLFLAICLLFSLNLSAQTQDSTIAIPNPSFENWSNGNGYSVTVVIFPLQVYSSYTYPTGWNYPTYPVNESITYSGMTVNVNTNLPLLKVANQTSGAVDGSHALKMQSFMLSDIISSTVYGLASSSLDPMLTTTVFPTVLSTGNVDIDNLLPLLSTLTANLGNLSQVLSTFVNVDVNTLIDGGVSLNGRQPSKLTGYYKYTSATSGDNGGVLILGTKYNTTTHRREAVGGGYTVALTDTASYAPFEVLYTPLSEVNSSYPYMEADSLIIMMLSSANATPQQGSALFLDNLQLWAQQAAVADTCAAVANLTVQGVDTMHATLNWTCTGTPDHFELEYGVQGFAHGAGTTVNVNGNTHTLSSLQPDTHYDAYVRSVCSSTLASDWVMVSFHTDTLVPPVIPDPDTCSAVFNLHVIEVDTNSATIGWAFEGDVLDFEAEYGAQGFTQGSGTTLHPSESFMHLSNLQPGTCYDIYVRCGCGSNLWGNWSSITFCTDTLVPPVIPDSDTCSAVFNLHVINVDTTSATIGWAFEGNVFDFEVEYGAQGFAQGSGTTLHPSESFLCLTDLQPDTYYDVYVRCGCGNDLWGEWAMMTFHTDTLPSVIDDSVGIHNYVNYEVKIYPNPAHGHCTLHFGQELPKVVRLYSIDGALLKEWIPQKETMELHLPESGAFLLYCETKSGVVVRKVVNR
jgi:hypothetical protein